MTPLNAKSKFLRVFIFSCHKVLSISLNLNTDLFINNGTLYFANKIKTIDHIGLILSEIHIHPMLHVSCKFGNDIQINKVIAKILVKDTKNY